MKKYLLKTLAILIILILVASNTVIFATTKSELNNQMSNIDDEIEKKEEELSHVQEEMSEARKQITELNNQIGEYETQIDELNSQLKELEASIKVQEENLEVEQENYDKQKDLLEKRLVAMYEAGSTSYIDVLLGSKDLTDFISYYYIVSEIAENDAQMLNDIEEKKKEIETAKSALEKTKEQIATKKESIQKTSNALASTKATKNKQMKELSTEERALQEELERFEKDKKDIQEQIARILREEAEAAKKNNISNNPSASGFINPIVGYKITTPFAGYAGHTGADFSGTGIYGKPVLAVKSGTVVTSTALTGSIPCYNQNGTVSGYYRSYGEYILINHHDGTMTLYAHGKPGSRLVEKGDEVKQGQQIMSVGNTGNVLPRPTKSNPTGGKHLHFEVQILKNGKAVAVNPAPYLP